MAQLRIVLSPEARADLLALEAYIAKHDGQTRAELILGRIEGTIRTLAFMPGMGSPRSFLEHGTRAFPVAPWIIVYAPLAALDGIRVVRVLDGRRDLPRIFRRSGRARRARH